MEPPITRIERVRAATVAIRSFISNMLGIGFGDNGVNARLDR